MSSYTAKLTGVVLAGFLYFVVIFACAPPTSPPLVEPPLEPPLGYTPVDLSDTYSGSGDEVIPVSTSGDVELTYNLHSLSGQDVYFVFTNTSLAEEVDNPWVMGSSGTVAPRSLALPRVLTTGENCPMAPTPPEIERFNSDPFGQTRLTAIPTPKGFEYVPPPTPDFYTEGDQESLFGRDSSAATATARKIVTADTAFGEKSLVIWVDDSVWSKDDAPLSGNVSPQMVSALAEHFLADSLSNDICDWVSEIFGDEWGAHPYSDLIADTGTIHVFLYDIDDDGYPPEGESRLWGFFWAKDNFERTSSGGVLDYSNERIMFYLDAPILAHDSDDDGSWEIDEDYCPLNMLSVMAHEYQHTIHFYQKLIVNQISGSSEPWLNEMASLVAEDLVSRHLGAKGPRGVDPDDGTAGSPYITAGRLPLFVAANDAPVTVWQDGEDVLKSYSVAYAFGAYLARNFGGPTFFRNLVQNTYTNYEAVEDALAQAGVNYSFEDILRRWGTSVLLSDNTDMEGTAAAYNKNGWFSSSLSGTNYDLGSINMYNYQYGSQKGLYIHSGDGLVGDEGKQQPSSNLYFAAGRNTSGTQTWTVWMRDAVKLTVVIKQ